MRSHARAAPRLLPGLAEYYSGCGRYSGAGEGPTGEPPGSVRPLCTGRSRGRGGRADGRRGAQLGGQQARKAVAQAGRAGGRREAVQVAQRLEHRQRALRGLHRHVPRLRGARRPAKPAWQPAACARAACGAPP